MYNETHCAFEHRTIGAFAILWTNGVAHYSECMRSRLGIVAEQIILFLFIVLSCGKCLYQLVDSVVEAGSVGG